MGRPLFIDDPSGGRRMVGEAVQENGVLWWVKGGVRDTHVMRSGKFGFDAATWDTHFSPALVGRRTGIRVRLASGITYEVDGEAFEAHATTGDYGHGRQYFLAFTYWNRAAGSDASPDPAPPEPDEPQMALGLGL